MKQPLNHVPIAERNQQILEHFARTGGTYEQVAKDLNMSPNTVASILNKTTVCGVIPKSINTDWFKEPEFIEIPVKVSVINGKVVHLIPSRINFEA